MHRARRALGWVGLAVLFAAATPYVTDQIDIYTSAKRAVVAYDNEDGSGTSVSLSSPLPVTAPSGISLEPRTAYKTGDCANGICDIPTGRGTFRVSLGAEAQDVALCANARTLVRLGSTGADPITVLANECVAVSSLTLSDVYVDTATYSRATTFRVIATY